MIAARDLRTQAAAVLWLAALALLPAAHADETNGIAQAMLPDRHNDDLDGMLARRTIRAVVAWNRTDYYVERGRQGGVAYEAVREFEKMVNARHGRFLRRIHVVILPVARDRLITMLENGEADIAVSGITVTPELAARIDFSVPIYDNVNEVLVGRRNDSAQGGIAALAGRTVHVRRSSSYASSLQSVNPLLAGAGEPPMTLRYIDEHLEDEDILEMVNIGLLESTVVDDYRALLWSQVLPGLHVHRDVRVREHASIAWGLRKNTPKFAALVNEFVKGHRVGTEFGNVLLRRYADGTRLSPNALAPAELARYRAVADTFRKYGEQYGFDHLMLTAMGFQESGLEPGAVSPEGAIGILQVMPSTGRAMKVGDIRQTEANIHAGVKYLRLLVDDYFSSPDIDPLNRTLFAFAAYNAGPTRIQKMRVLARRRGLDANRWYDNVDRVVAEQIGLEPVNYVVNIGRYYLAYSLIEEQRRDRAAARAAAAP